MAAFGFDSCSVDSLSMGSNPWTGSYETLHMAEDHGYDGINVFIDLTDK